ncbi:hypothetical protein RND81_03G093000 [Saponaria officinalis]|uniref:Uncharacterized protein n=1 Tax=Saponaria officinalis TaxID=3572 RepID=A0AAW1M402_SAPOF
MTQIYNLDSNEEFIWSDGKYIWVSILKDLNTALVQNNNWKHLDTGIGPRQEYTGLMLFGSELSGSTFESLVGKLSESLLMVNREGLCFLRCAGIFGPSFREEYLRLNDLFDWNYEFDLVFPIIETSWKRCGLENGRVLVKE